jgi:hypothetical protein
VASTTFPQNLFLDGLQLAESVRNKIITGGNKGYEDF